MEMEIDERARMAALRAYRILDTDPETGFDDLTLLASQICNTPIALISLIDENRQWFKSRVGVTAQQTSRDIAFCAHAIRQTGLFVVPDTLEDERFRNNPLVASDPRIRFYTGAPLWSREGQALGTLCVLDRQPRTLSDRQIEALEALRRQVMAQLELRRNLQDLRRTLDERDRAEEAQERLVGELREALDHVRKLSGLVPICRTCKLDVTIPADPKAIPGVVAGVMQIVGERRCAAGHEVDVEIALHEAIANAIKHGCNSDPSKSIQCCVAVESDDSLLVVVRDPGPGFDLSSVPSPLAKEGWEKENGRGIFLINQFMDEVMYEDGGRELRMRRRAQAH